MVDILKVLELGPTRAKAAGIGRILAIPTLAAIFPSRWATYPEVSQPGYGSPRVLCHIRSSWHT